MNLNQGKAYFTYFHLRMITCHFENHHIFNHFQCIFSPLLSTPNYLCIVGGFHSLESNKATSWRIWYKRMVVWMYLHCKPYVYRRFHSSISSTLRKGPIWSAMDRREILQYTVVIQWSSITYITWWSKLEFNGSISIIYFYVNTDEYCNIWLSVL